MAAKPVFFRSPAQFRAWLAKDHRKEAELWVGYHKVGTGRPSLTWAESVDQGLCFGWIDGKRMRIDDERYMIRFTPRKASSNWSAVNVRRFQELQEAGLVMPAGREAFERRTAARTGVYAYENRHKARFTVHQEKKFRQHSKAWAFFAAQPPSYRSLATWWVNSAKREDTRPSRFEKVVRASARRVRLGSWERVSPTPSKAT